MTPNEKKFVKAVIDYAVHIKEAQEYIKENFNIDSEYNDDTAEIKLSCEDVSEAINLVAAKDYIEENLKDTFINVIF